MFDTTDFDDAIKPESVKSFSMNQRHILEWIIKLHCPGGFELDMTYGNGRFYKGIDEPKYKFDIDPQQEGVVKASSECLPVDDESISSAVFDPPFITYVKKGREHNSIMASRFGGYYTYAELEDHYIHSISEAHRILKPGGIFVVKCQDLIHHHKFHATHVFVMNRAEIEGFRPKDLFVLAAHHRMKGPQKGQQRHARIHQSFFWVFEKPLPGRKR